METEKVRVIFRKEIIINYFLRTIRQSRKNAEQHSIENYNALYRWKIGNLEEEEIKETVLEYFEKGESMQNLNLINIQVWKNKDLYDAFYILIESVKEEMNSLKETFQHTKQIHPSKFGHDNWVNIRNNYFRKIKEASSSIFSWYGENLENRAEKQEHTGSAFVDNELLELIQDEFFNHISYPENNLKIGISFELSSSNLITRFSVINLNMEPEEPEKLLNKIKEEIDDFISIRFSNTVVQIISNKGYKFITGSFVLNTEKINEFELLIKDYNMIASL
jgi:hypothetical protein